MKTRTQMTKAERIADTVRSGTRTSRILDKIRKERKNEVCVTFAREGSKPLTDREHTLDATVRREVLKNQISSWSTSGAMRFTNALSVLAQLHAPSFFIFMQ